ncbi:MAG: hypothetical protein H6510_04215 [Acidobacteria bacterium]|nr:hypothetical protein [Acidobacteriota bacterium]MCB9397001.1 hypothetical protein [Acidobacteriota bacterium]
MSELQAIAYSGFQRAQERLLTASDRIASGSLSVENIVEQVAAATDVKAQLKNVKVALELEDHIIDLLA